MRKQALHSYKNFGPAAYKNDQAKRAAATRSTIVKKLDFYNQMVNTGSGKKRGDSSSSDEATSEVGNRYGRRGNNGPIKPVHHRADNDAEADRARLAYEPVNPALMHTPDRR